MVTSALNWFRAHLPQIFVIAGLILAGGSGFAASTALGLTNATPITTTVNVATGPQGPAGPPGPAGTSTCPDGYDAGKLVINHPGGQTAIWTCIAP